MVLYLVSGSLWIDDNLKLSHQNGAGARNFVLSGIRVVYTTPLGNRGAAQRPSAVFRTGQSWAVN